MKYQNIQIWMKFETQASIATKLYYYTAREQTELATKNFAKFVCFERHKKESGFIALISAIIISAILMAILFTANTSTFFARFDALDTEYKRVAMGLAESCVNQALLKLAQNYNYDPTDEIVSVGGDTCYIKSITPHPPRSGNSTLITINTQANHQGAFSNFQVKALVQNPKISPSTFPPPPNIKINSWQEMPVSP